MNDNELSMLRYSLKQCEKSFMDARDNPRYWEQAFLNSEGLLEKLPNLPAEERAPWEKKLKEWIPQMQAGADLAVGERILRSINDSLQSAANDLAQDNDPTNDFERLERELANEDTIRCVPKAELTRVKKELASLQATLSEKAAEHQLVAAVDRLSFAEEKLAEYEQMLQQNPSGSDAYLARNIAGNFETADAEIDRLPEAHAERKKLTKQLQNLRKRFEAL